MANIAGSITSIIALTIVFFIVIQLAAVCCVMIRRRKLQSQYRSTNIPQALTNSTRTLNEDNRRMPSHLGPRHFSLQELRAATKDFDETMLLGQGGFGRVYKGILPENNVEVAVKSISDDPKDEGYNGFIAEVTIISNLRHQNLISLQGWGHAEGRLYVVYDYMPYGSLDTFLYNDEKCVALDWRRRFEISCGLASALLYLHEECGRTTIHRDIKSSNVLLDGQFATKLGDFGLSRQMDHGNSAYTTLVAGTRGYIAPELCVGLAKATKASDMFSFGVVLGEIVTGKRPIQLQLVSTHNGLLMHWLWDLYHQGNILLAVDERLNGMFDTNQMVRVLTTALACCNHDPKSRPTIKNAINSLYGLTQLPSIPSFKSIYSNDSQDIPSLWSSSQAST